MPVEAADRVGSVIDGRYKIVEVMASGSMGAVYKAERIPVGKLVAVKFLHASFANDSEFQARFERETRVMSKLNHPNCVSVLDFGVWENAPYLVMDFVAGFTLRARIDKAGAIPPIEALGMARQILSGLAHAHQQEVFHRDVKPANIMISEEIGHGERVRILDFGLARLQGNVGRDATQTNMVVGTPNYMAPEQTVPGSAVDGRTDLYAVGVVLYEMIVGDRPFQAEDTMQLLGMHRAAPIPRLADRVPESLQLPVGLQDLIDKAMAKAPAHRFQTAIEFAQAIDEVIAGKLDVTELDVTLPKMKSGPVKMPTEMRASQKMGLASTIFDLNSSDLNDQSIRPKKSSKLWLGALILVGGGAAMAGYLIKRNHEHTAATGKVVEVERDAGSALGSAAIADDAPTAVATNATNATADAAMIEPMATADAGAADDAAIAVAALDDAAVNAFDPGDGGTDNGVDEEEIQIDPAKVEDPDTAAGSTTTLPEDEEENAPKTEQEVEKREPAPPAPSLATSVKGAVAMIKAGRKELALASLRQLWKKQPNSGYIPFLMGNLYFDKKWWSVSMDHYKAAIKKNAGYRSNAVLNRNVIRMLASTKTRQTATNFLRGVIGRPSRNYLNWAAAHETNPTVRKQAKALAPYIR